MSDSVPIWPPSEKVVDGVSKWGEVLPFLRSRTLMGWTSDLSRWTGV